MANPLRLEQMQARTKIILDTYAALETEVFKRLALALRRGEGQEIMQYILEKAASLNMLEVGIEKELAKVTGKLEAEIVKAIEDNGYAVIDDTDKYLNIAGIETEPLKDIGQLVRSYADQATLELDNYINERLITSNLGTGTLRDMGRQVLDDISVGYATGAYTLDEAIENTVMRWVDKGLPSAFYDRAGRRWSLERYAAMVLRSTNARLYNNLRTNRMEEFGIHLVLMSSKLAARPACAPIQGKVLDITPDRQYPNYPNIYDYGYGTPAGTRGINCGHLWFPYREGVSINTQIQYDPDEAMRMERLNQHRNRLLRDIQKLGRKVDVAMGLGADSLAKYNKLLTRAKQRLKYFDKQYHKERHELHYSTVGWPSVS